MSIKKFVEITFQKEGIHCYPAAGTDPKLKEVEFLAYPHRHMFHFKVKIEVFHDNRDIEFILLKRQCEETYSDATLKLDYKSCEMIATELLDLLQLWFGKSRDMTVSVSEDGENGAVVEYIPDSTMPYPHPDYEYDTHLGWVIK